ncbi:MAG: hypothetical protein NVS4B3_15090 [Gemmatimonadaceae bacterium]
MVTIFTAAGCSLDRGVEPRRPPPTVTAVLAEQNPYDALSIVVTCRVSDADSARLLLRVAGEPDSATPFVHTATGSARMVALGLHAATPYSVVVQAAGVGGTTESERLGIETTLPPAAVRSLRLAVDGERVPGYTILVPLFGEPDAQAFILGFDGAGELRWYRSFSGEGWAVEAKQQPNGNFTAYLGRSFGWQPTTGRFVEFTASGEEVRTFRVPSPAYTDPHEILLTFHGRALSAVHLLGYEIKTVDAQLAGGAADASLAVHSIVRESATGTREFSWNAADHFTVADWPPATAALPPDLVHPSSLALDRDGNYILSLQGVDEIIKVHATTGAVMWRLGGKHNEFAIRDDPLGGFTGQHSVRVLDNGHLLFLDNRVRTPGASARAVEYSLDVPGRTARLVWEYRPNPGVLSPILGSVQRFTDGATLVGFGVAGRVIEVDAAGRIRWAASLTQEQHTPPVRTPVKFYRAIRVPSLYEYREP